MGSARCTSRAGRPDLNRTSCVTVGVLVDEDAPPLPWNIITVGLLLISCMHISRLKKQGRKQTYFIIRLLRRRSRRDRIGFRMKSIDTRRLREEITFQENPVGSLEF